MSKLSTKILTAVVLTALAVEPAMVSAFTVTSGGTNSVQSTGGVNYQVQNSNSDTTNHQVTGTGSTAITSYQTGNSNTGTSDSAFNNGTTNSQVPTSTTEDGNTDSTTNFQTDNNNGGMSDDIFNDDTTNYQTPNNNGGMSDDVFQEEDDDDNDGVISACGGRAYPKDIDGHWAEIYIRRLYDLCIIEGYSDGRFHPNQNITRAELTKMALYSRGIKPNNGCYDADCGSPFMDLDRWQSKWIRPAWDRGIVQGYNHNTFRPNRSITRAEAVKIVLATYDEEPEYTNDSFFNDVSGWSKGWIERAHNIGIVQGIGNGNFDPNRPITRAEAAKIIAKTMEYWDTKIR